jgi:hypothetical protein
MKCAYLAASSPEWLADHLRKKGADIISVEPRADVSGPVADHPDIAMCKLGSAGQAPVVMAPEGVLGSGFPGETAYDAACTGDFFIHRLEYTAPELLSEARSRGMELIDTRQAYTKCSTVIVDERSVITYDRAIAAPCRKAGMDVLEISPGHVSLPGYDSGFIGGASGRFEDELIFCGDLSEHPDYARIRAFIEERGLKCVFFPGRPLTDIGSIIEWRKD